MRLLILFVFLLISSNANAEVYVLINSDSEVLAAGEVDDFKVEEGQTKIVLPGKLEDYGLTLHPTYYKIVEKRDNAHGSVVTPSATSIRARAVSGVKPNRHSSSQVASQSCRQLAGVARNSTSSAWSTARGIRTIPIAGGCLAFRRSQSFMD